MDYDNPPSKTPPERITMASIGRLMLQTFNLEKGVFYTLWGLTLWPEKVINVYLFEDRKKATKPFTFMLMITAVMAYVTLNIVDFNAMLTDGMVTGDTAEAQDKQKLVRNIIVDLYNRWFNVLSFTTIPFAALTTYWFFRRAKYFFAEHLIINTFIVAYTGVFLIITTIFTPIFGYFIVSLMYFVLSLIYSVYAYGRIFHQYTWWQSVPRSTLAFTIYYILYIFIFAIFIAIAIAIQLNSSK